MTLSRRSLSTILIVIGAVCLAWAAFEVVQAQAFQHEERVAFERVQDGAPAPTGLIGRLDIPRLDISVMVMEGDDARTLKTAVGHLPDTALPWEAGNSAIAGHRDTFFRPLKDIRTGDEIRLTSPRGEFVYRVRSTRIVSPQDLSVLAPTAASTLTLVTCYPFYYVGAAPKRFIVQAEPLATYPPTRSQ
jgi:sortase A